MHTRLLVALCLGTAAVYPPALAAQNDTAHTALACRDKPCSVVFDWGGTQPDPDRRYGAPSDLEANFFARLREAGFNITTSNQGAMIVTLRLTPKKRALCDTMEGTSPDYSCHTVDRASIVFVPNDSSAKTIGRIDVTPRCSNPMVSITFPQFGNYAADWVAYTLNNDKKAQRPNAKC
jgi:hypothetical protein